MPDYGARHRRIRARWAPRVAAGTVECARCHRLIKPGEPWDLDHRDGEPHVYLGPSHARCNRATDPRYRAKRPPERHPGDINALVDKVLDEHGETWRALSNE